MNASFPRCDVSIAGRDIGQGGESLAHRHTDAVHPIDEELARLRLATEDHAKSYKQFVALGRRLTEAEQELADRRAASAAPTGRLRRGARRSAAEQAAALTEAAAQVDVLRAERSAAGRAHASLGDPAAERKLLLEHKVAVLAELPGPLGDGVRSMLTRRNGAAGHVEALRAAIGAGERAVTELDALVAQVDTSIDPTRDPAPAAVLSVLMASPENMAATMHLPAAIAAAHEAALAFDLALHQAGRPVLGFLRHPDVERGGPDQLRSICRPAHREATGALQALRHLLVEVNNEQAAAAASLRDLAESTALPDEASS